MMITCPLCAGSFGTLSVFLTHVRLVHASDASFHIPCGLQGCQRTFRNFYTYRNHVYSFHDLSNLENTNSTESMDSTTWMEIEVNESTEVNDTDLTNMQHEANETNVETAPDLVCDSTAGVSTEGTYKIVALYNTIYVASHQVIFVRKKYTLTIDLLFLNM